MLQLREIASASTPDRAAVVSVLTLTCADRRRSRLRARLDDGREVALMLPRGSILRDGDRLLDGDGNPVVAIRAAPETLSVARTDSHHTLCRAAYHLGNRHVPVQLGVDWLAYQHDHVLDEMVRALGLVVAVESRPFEPETGGYAHANDRAPAAGPHHESHRHAH